MQQHQQTTVVQGYRGGTVLQAPPGGTVVQSPQPAAPQTGKCGLTCCPAKTMLIVAIIALTFVCVVGYIAFITPFMVVTKGSYTGLSYGIYQACIPGSYGSYGRDAICSTYSDKPGWLSASQGMGALAAILMGIGWCFLLVWACRSQNKSCIKITVLCLITSGVVLFGATLILFTAKWEEAFGGVVLGSTLDSFLEYGWSFYVAWIAAGLLVLINIWLFLIPAVPDPPQVMLSYVQQPQVMQVVHTQQQYQPPPQNAGYDQGNYQPLAYNQENNPQPPAYNPQSYPNQAFSK